PLVFVRLLIGDTDQIGQLLLGQTKHDSPLTNAGTDMSIDILGSAGRAARRCSCVQPIRLGTAGTRSKSIATTCHSDLLLFSHPARLAFRCQDRQRIAVLPLRQAVLARSRLAAQRLVLSD